ncbi:MAG: ribokinase [Anaerolineaceae bacterium]|nr:MAG: ribokinase [Anaerolineaceae bacterium]
MGRIIVAGSINMDVVARVKAHPQLGETVFGTDLQFIPGGKGSNQAIAASRLTDGVLLAGMLGVDAFGDTLMTFLQGENLDLRHVGRVDTAPTGTALIAVSDASENTIIVVPGSNAHLQPADVSKIPIDPDDVVVSVFEIPQETIRALFARAHDVGAKTVLNPAPANPFIPSLLALTDYLIVNETELAFFADGASVTDNLADIKVNARNLRSSESQTIIVTLGDKGAVGFEGDAMIHVAGHTVNAVDTTGAGDCFVGALSVALSEGRNLKAALEFANSAAALSVQKLGASTSMPYRID